MSWSAEIKATAAGENNRTLEWCALELQLATRALVFDYLRLRNALRWRRRRSGHVYDFACCRADRDPVCRCGHGLSEHLPPGGECLQGCRCERFTR